MVLLFGDNEEIESCCIDLSDVSEVCACALCKAITICIMRWRFETVGSSALAGPVDAASKAGLRWKDCLEQRSSGNHQVTQDATGGSYS